MFHSCQFLPIDALQSQFYPIVPLISIHPIIMTSLCAILMLLVVMVATGHALPREFALHVGTGKGWKQVCRWKHPRCFDSAGMKGTINVKVYGRKASSQTIAFHHNGSYYGNEVQTYNFRVDRDLGSIINLQIQAWAEWDFRYVQKGFESWWKLANVTLQHIAKVRTANESSPETHLGPSMVFNFNKWVKGNGTIFKSSYVVVEPSCGRMWSDWSACSQTCGQGKRWRLKEFVALDSEMTCYVKREGEQKPCERLPACVDE